MRIRARRGVCIGVDRHLKAGGLVPADVDAATLQFLRSIGAVEPVPDEPAAAEQPQHEPNETKGESADSKLETGKKKK